MARGKPDGRITLGRIGKLKHGYASHMCPGRSCGGKTGVNILIKWNERKVGETTIRIRERNEEKLVGKDSRGDLILVKEKGKTRSHIHLYHWPAITPSLSFKVVCHIGDQRKKPFLTGLTGNQKEKPPHHRIIYIQ